MCIVCTEMGYEQLFSPFAPFRVMIWEFKVIMAFSEAPLYVELMRSLLPIHVIIIDIVCNDGGVTRYSWQWVTVHLAGFILHRTHTNCEGESLFVTF